MNTINMKITLINLNDYEFEEAYLTYKESLHVFIENAFGWNESDQVERFRSYRNRDFRSINCNGIGVGYLCYALTGNKLHIHLIAIKNMYRGLGYGKAAMIEMEIIAGELNVPIEMSSFIANTSANIFYRKLGYHLSVDDNVFYKITKPAQQCDSPEHFAPGNL